MKSDARIIRRLTRVLAQADITDVTVTDAGKNEDGSWWLLCREEWGHGKTFAPYYRVNLTIREDDE